MKKKLISLMLAGVLVFGTFSSAGADEISDLENEAAYNQQQLEDLNASIDDIETQKAELLGDIDEAETQLVLTLASISSLTDQIDIKTNELNLTTKDLDEAEKDEATQYEAMKKRIQYLYETGGDAGWAIMLLEDANITDFLNRAEYTQQMYDYDRKCLEEYADTVERVSTLKDQKETEKTELERMLSNQEEQQAHLEDQLTQMKAESTDYEQRLAEATAAADAYVDLINQQNSMIQELLAEQERQRQEAEAAAAQAAAEAAEAAAAQAAAAEAAAAQAAAEQAAAEQAAAEQAAAAQAAAAQAAAEAAAQAADEGARAQAEAEAAAAQAAAEQAAAEAAAAQAAAEQAAAEQAAAEQAAAEQAAAEQAAAEQAAAEQQQEVVEDTSASVVPSGYPIVDRAYAWVGRAEYVWGACSPGAFDCSGFVSYCVTGVYARIGTTYTFLTFPQVSDPIPGDICTSETHCGIYIGNGMMIHASDYGVGVIISEVRPNMIYVRY